MVARFRKRKDTTGSMRFESHAAEEEKAKHDNSDGNDDNEDQGMFVNGADAPPKAEVVDRADGRFEISYWVPEAGAYRLEVMLRSESEGGDGSVGGEPTHVTGSPAELLIFEREADKAPEKETPATLLPPGAASALKASLKEKRASLAAALQQREEEEKKLRVMEKLRREEVTRRRAQQALRAAVRAGHTRREEAQRKASIKRTGGGFIVKYNDDSPGKPMGSDGGYGRN